MTKKLNIALITDVLPDKARTPGQVLEQIVSKTPQASFDIYWLNQSHLPKPQKLPANAALVCHVKFSPARLKLITITRNLTLPFVQLYRFFKYNQRMQFIYARDEQTAQTSYIRRPLFKRWYNFIRYARAALHAYTLGSKLHAEIKDKNYDAIWLVLQGETLLVAYIVLAWKTKKKIILQQWDPIGWWTQHRNYTPRIITLFNRLAGWLETRAHVNLVPSHAWQAIQTKQNLRSIRVDNFFSEKVLAQRPLLKLSTPNQLNAVFIGQVYSETELVTIAQMLLQACYSQGKNLCLHYFGSTLLNVNLGSINIINHAYMDRDLLINRIRKFDLALLPYPLEKRFEQASTYSFPSKSRVYLVAGLPILANAALDSSPHLFYQKYYREYYFNVQADKDLSAFVKSIATATSNAHVARNTAAIKLAKEHFSSQAELRPIHEMLKGIAT